MDHRCLAEEEEEAPEVRLQSLQSVVLLQFRLWCCRWASWRRAFRRWRRRRRRPLQPPQPGT